MPDNMSVPEQPNPRFDGTAARALSDLAARVVTVERQLFEVQLIAKTQADTIGRLTKMLDDQEAELTRLRENSVPLKTYEKLEANIGKVVMAIVLAFLAAIGTVVYRKNGG